MDKATFVRIAPQYYGAAIIVYLEEFRRATFSENVSNHYRVKDDSGEIFSLLARDKLFDIAVAWLNDKEVVDVIRDPFGPDIINISDEFDERVRELREDQNFPLFKSGITGTRTGWLRSALLTLERNYSELGIVDADFDEPDKEWEPLALERDDPQLQKIIQTVDETVQKVRADNGYAANLPEERDYVVDGLSTLLRRLKEAATISVNWRPPKTS